MNEFLHGPPKPDTFTRPVDDEPAGETIDFALEAVEPPDPEIPIGEQMRSSVDLRDHRLLNALSTSPDPGPMGPMYYNLREIMQNGERVFKDGMTLACASPKRPYEDIVLDYEVQSQEPGFSDLDFFYENFDVNPLDEMQAAEPGQTLNDFIKYVRPLLIKSSTEYGTSDIQLPADAVMAALARFLQAYHWDSGYAAEGLASDGLHGDVHNMVINTVHEINEFGHPINGTVNVFTTRPQPPHFALMLKRLEDRIGPEAITGSYLDALEIEHDYWMDGAEDLLSLPDDGESHSNRALVRTANGALLNRYWDDAKGPRLESYWEDVNTANEVLGAIEATGESLSDEQRELKREEIYKHIRAAAAAGWDFSARWCESGGDLSTICTTDIIPIDLNCLLVIQETTLAEGYETAAETVTGDQRVEYLRRARQYREMAKVRAEAINELCWDDENKIYRDFNHVKDEQTDVVSSAMVYALLAGVASQVQAHGIMECLKDGTPEERVPLLREGGVISTTVMDSPQQWDGLNVWAPPNWSAMAGFTVAGHEFQDEELLEFADIIKANFMNGIETAYEETNSIPEKIDGDNPRVPAGGGEYELVMFLTMMAEAYRAADKLKPRDSDNHLARRRMAQATLERVQRPETN